MRIKILFLSLAVFLWAVAGLRYSQTASFNHVLEYGQVLRVPLVMVPDNCRPGSKGYPASVEIAPGNVQAVTLSLEECGRLKRGDSVFVKYADEERKALRYLPGERLQLRDYYLELLLLVAGLVLLAWVLLRKKTSSTITP